MNSKVPRPGLRRGSSAPPRKPKSAPPSGHVGRNEDEAAPTRSPAELAELAELSDPIAFCMNDLIVFDYGYGQPRDFPILERLVHILVESVKRRILRRRGPRLRDNEQRCDDDADACS